MSEGDGFGPQFWLNPEDPPTQMDGAEANGDARVLFDPFTRQFIVIIGRDTTARLLLGVSHGYDAATHPNDPEDRRLQSWYKYSIDTRYCDDQNPPFCRDGFDYFGLGVSADAIWLSASQSVGPQSGQLLHIFRKPPISPDDGYVLTNPPTNHAQVLLLVGYQVPFGSDEVFFPMPAVSFDTPATPTGYLVQIHRLSEGDPPHGQIRLTAIRSYFTANPQIDYYSFDCPRISYWYDGTAELDTRQLCAPVPAGLVAASRGGVQNAVLLNGKLYFAHEHVVQDGVSVARIAVRWYVVDLHGWPTSGQSPSLAQSGLLDGGRVFLDDDSTHDVPVHYAFRLIFPTTNGSLALFSTRIHPRSYVDLCWTGRRGDDTAGLLGVPVSTMTYGSAGVDPAFRWGEYEGIARDPLDANTTWGCGETGRCPTPPCMSCSPTGIYQSDYHTSIGSYKLPAKPVRTLTAVLGVDQPDSVKLKLSPPDGSGKADFLLDAATLPTDVRRFGHGTSVTLRAPNLKPQWAFKYWLVDGDEVSSGTGTDPRQLALPMLADHEVRARYTQAE